jgi:hypothetical protein
VIGSIPGIYVGSKIANRVPQMFIRRGIVLLLFVTGLGLVGVEPVLALTIGAVAFVLGTIGWALLRRRYGLPAFATIARMGAPDKAAQEPRAEEDQRT